MKIYFGGAITGGRDNADLYPVMVNHLKNYGDVLTEHLADPRLSNMGEAEKTPKFVHDRDMEWLESSDVVVAKILIDEFFDRISEKVGVMNGRPKM